MAVPLREIELRASRSSGPGGQHANVTASRVEAVFDVAASRALSDAQKTRVMSRCGPLVRATAQDTRKPRHATKPSKAAVERRLQEKRRRGQRKAERRRPVDE